MWLNGWKRCFLVMCLLLGWWESSQAQRSVPKLDRLPIWYHQSASDDRSARHNSYLNLHDLVQKAKAGNKIESLSLGELVLKQGDIASLAELKDVRVLTVHNLTDQNKDSLFQAIQDWHNLERLVINADRAESKIILPLSLQRLTGLQDIRLMVDCINWKESISTLANIKTLKHLEISNWGEVKSPLPDLYRLNQIKSLSLIGSGWVLQSSTFVKQMQVTELNVYNINVDATVFQAELNKLSKLEALLIVNSLALQGLTFNSLKSLKSVELNQNPDLVIYASMFDGLPNLQKLSVDVAKSVDLSGICTLPYLKVLRLSNVHKPMQLSDCISQLTELTELEINGKIDKLPTDISGLKKLRKVRLMNCALDWLPDTFGQLSALEELTLSGSKLRRLPALGHLKQLRRLSVWDNQLTTLPEDIGQLTQLTTLVANQNKLTQLPASLSQLVSLGTLELRNNQLERLPEDLGKLRNLKSLWIDNNQLVSLPSTIGQLHSLQSIQIGSNHLRSLPASFTNLGNLTDLQIGANDINALPTDIGALRQLKTLILKGIPITVLPASVGELTKLESLEIAGTKLRLLPNEIGQLTTLQSLVLAGNELITLPSTIGLCKDLKSLSLYETKLDRLPESIGRLTKLADLRIGRIPDGTTNGIGQLPDSIVYCVGLEGLSIQHQPRLNGDDLFKKAVKLKALSSISVIDCNLKRLPDINWKETNLLWLNLFQNSLTELPVALLDAPKLTTLLVYQNKLPDVLNCEITSKEYLRVAFVEMGMLSPETISKPNRKVAQVYEQVAREKADQRDWLGALKDIQKAINYTSDTTLAWYYAERGRLHVLRNDYDEALSDFDRAIYYAPNLLKEKHNDSLSFKRTMVWFWQQKAAVLGTIGRFNEAIASIVQAECSLPSIEQSQRVGEIYAEKGRYLTLMDKLVSADSSYRKAIAAYEQSRSINSYVRLEIAQLGLFTEQYDQAQEALVNISTEQVTDGLATLKEYFIVCLEVVNGEQKGAQAVEQLRAYLTKQSEKIKEWDFTLLESWLSKAKLSDEKITALRQLTDMTKKRLIKME